MPRRLRGLIGVAAFLVLCEAVGRAGLVRQEYLPPPSVVAARLAGLLGTGGFVADTVATVLAALLALGIAAAIAIPAGLVLGSVPSVRHAAMGLVELLRPVPSVALIPFVLFLLGAGPESKIVLAVYAALWPILFNTIYAINEIDPLRIETARAFALPRSRILTTVALPSAAPFAVTGTRTASAICLIVVISTELLAPSSGGLGQVIFVASSNSQMDVVLAGTVVAGLLGYLIDATFRRAQRRWLSWAEEGELAG